MTSGSKICTRLLGAALALSLSAMASASEADAGARRLIASLGRPAPARTAFAEARFMKVLDQPLVLSGELAWLGGDRLERRVDKPRPESFSIAGGVVTERREGRKPRSFSLQRAPQLQGLLDSFVALLGGDASKLGDAFQVRRDGDSAGSWTLSLTPNDPKVAQSVASIHIDGYANAPHCMTLREADGDVSIDLLGALAARMPPAPTPDALAALCRVAH